MKFAIRFFAGSWLFVLIVAFLGAALATGASVLLPWQYAADTQLLVTQNTAASVDPYTAIKSSERIASNLGDLTYTSKFMDKILAQAVGFDAKALPKDEVEKRKVWQKMITVAVAPGSGLLTITVFHPQKTQAVTLATAISLVLTNEASNYFGYNVRAEVINAPVASKWIARPSFAKNAALGFLGGLVIGLGFVVWKLRSRDNGRF